MEKFINSHEFMNHEMIVEISKGYQISIPAEIRKKFHLGIGSSLDISAQKGRIIIEPVKENMLDMFRNAKNIKPKKNLTVKQMEKLNEGIFR
jgi:AbrB family looped-hinge helix DNA binding protein